MYPRKEKISGFLKLMRWQQWYKNLIVFVALFFAGELMNLQLLLKSLIGFISLCLISSANYMINDMVDVENDRRHPEKRKRPIASGIIKMKEAGVFAALLIISSMSLAYLIGTDFAIFPAMLLISTSLYSAFLKNFPIVDIHIIALNFIIRAVAGAVAIERYVSPWLIVVVFFIALFLAAGKRKGDLLVRKKAGSKNTHNVYDPRFLDSLLTVLAACLLISYTIYTFNSPAGEKMMLTIPLASFLIMRYYHLAEIGDRAGRQAEYLFLDKQWMFGFLLWMISCFFIFYGSMFLQ